MRLETCVGKRNDRCSPRRLQLNPDKTQLIWFGSRANLSKLKRLDVMSLTLCSVVIEPVDSVRDLGVILDSELECHSCSEMQKHIGTAFSFCFFHIRRLRKLRSMLDQSSAQRLVSAFILSRIDYCNAVLAGLAATTIAPLVRVLNADAGLVTSINEVHASEMMITPLAPDCVPNWIQTVCPHAWYRQ